MMNHHKIHESSSYGGNVPFSWENKPGVSKVNNQQERDHLEKLGKKIQLPPPPCPVESGSRACFHDLQVPLPPCGFQPPSRSSSRKGLRKQQDDPFLTAYRECTKSSNCRRGKGDVSGFGLRKNMSIFSCKTSCSVMDDSMVKISRLPYSKSERMREKPPSEYHYTHI